MRSSYVKIMLCLLIYLAAWMPKSIAKTDTKNKEISVAMRMIGHEILLLAGDSSSRVLPIEKVDERYKIQFESAFQLLPGELVATVTHTLRKYNLAETYLVEVESCETNQVVYSYKVGKTDPDDIIPCTGREYPNACYDVFISILDGYHPFAFLQMIGISNKDSSSPEAIGSSSFKLLFWMLPLCLLIASGFYLWKKKQALSHDPSLLTIGNYVFDQSKMELSFGKDHVELSGIETELLLFLHAHVNTVLEREFILQQVWGDNGSYVGRTVDVFISKLRKKLEADPNVKIVNIRGVGYKLIVNA